MRIPKLVPEFSTEHRADHRVDRRDGFDEFRKKAVARHQAAVGEVIWRFAQNAIFRYGVFNGDPHPGNYKFHHDGSVTFLDFGLVKRWTPGEWERLRPTMDAIIVDRDPELFVATMESSGFLRPGHGLDPTLVYDYVSSPYTPYLTDEFTFTRDWMRDTLGVIFDVQGPHGPVIEQLNMPPSFVILDRVVWGVSAILGKLEAKGPWRSMLMEYTAGGPPRPISAPPKPPGPPAAPSADRGSVRPRTVPGRTFADGLTRPTNPCADPSTRVERWRRPRPTALPPTRRRPLARRSLLGIGATCRGRSTSSRRRGESVTTSGPR